MPLMSDRVLESTTTTGTGTFSLGGALTGYRAFNSAFSNGDVVYYTADNGQGEWEVGYGTVGTGTLTRDTVLESSNANALVDFSAGTKRLFCTAPASAIVNASLLGSGVATFLATPSSANLAAAVTDETGSGALVFGTSPTLTTPTNTGLRETKTAPSISSNTLTLDCSVGNVFAVSLNANITTLSFTNVPATGTAYALTLSFTADGTARTVTWGASVLWPSGTAPTLTSTNAKVDTFVLTTWDGGTTWYAFIGGQNA